MMEGTSSGAPGCTCRDAAWCPKGEGVNMGVGEGSRSLGPLPSSTNRERLTLWALCLPLLAALTRLF